jgi:NRPS condensation-like uncharacterized protein
MSVTGDSMNHANTRTTTEFVRSVDSLERLFYRFSERNPAHFSIVAEFGVTLTEAKVRTALLAVQQRHPHLSVHVEDHPGSRLGFYRADAVAPIDLTVHETGEPWQSVAAAELAHPFDRSQAPLMRAVLVNGPSGSTIVLTFDHTIADGISSVIVMNDLVNALNGRTEPPLDVPPSVEDLIARTLAAPEDQGTNGPSDPRMAAPTSVRPFDGIPPYVHTVTLDGADTAQLVNLCRAEQTTVHAAILAAASRSHAMLLGTDFVRVLSPINIRSLIDAGDGCADYFSCTTTAMSPSDGTAFWDHARAVTAELSVARSAPAVAAASATIQQAITVDAECATTEQFFTTGMPCDVLITNLGVQDLQVDGPIRPTALWGPVVESQMDDFAVGVITYEGRLRMTACGYLPTEAFLDGVTAMLGRAMQPALVSLAAAPR